MADRRMKVGLLVFDHVSSELVGIAGDYDAMFRRLLVGHSDVELLDYDVINGQIPSSPNECDGWLTTGSRHSVNDDFDWIRQMEDFTRKTATVGIPFVGVCFGHQLLAKSLGGHVGQSEKGWGLGVKTVQVVQGLSFIPSDVESFHIMNSHRDQIQKLPGDAVAVGWNDHCPVSAMTVGPSILGIQGHPEMEVDLVEKEMTILVRDLCKRGIDTGIGGSDRRPGAHRNHVEQSLGVQNPMIRIHFELRVDIANEGAGRVDQNATCAGK